MKRRAAAFKKECRFRIQSGTLEIAVMEDRELLQLYYREGGMKYLRPLMVNDDWAVFNNNDIGLVRAVQLASDAAFLVVAGHRKSIEGLVMEGRKS